MGNKNRDSLRIIADILSSTNSGVSKTKIMFSANLSFKLLEKYLAIVIGSGLVQVNGSKYELTLQGREFIKNYNTIEERYVSAHKMVESLDSERKKLSLIYENSIRI